jgi:hypothetical protein
LSPTISAPAATAITRGSESWPCAASAAATIRLVSPGTRAPADSAATKPKSSGQPIPADRRALRGAGVGGEGCVGADQHQPADRGAIGVAAAITIATTFTGHYVNGHPGVTALSGGALTHGFQIAFYALAAVAAAGAVLALLMIESRPPPVAQEAPVEEEVARRAA